MESEISVRASEMKTILYATATLCIGQHVYAFVLSSDGTRCSVTNVPDGSETITLQEGDSSMQLGPDDVVSTITLSCTVTNEGLFQIQWVLPDMTTVESTWVADGSRTGILQVSRLSGAGEMDYQCRASYVLDGLPSGPPSSSMATATFTLDFQGKIKCAPVLYCPVVM